MTALFRPSTAILLASALASVPSVASATDGYFQDGVSIRDKGMAGAGVADPDDPMILTANPAGIAEIDDEVILGASVFSPRRQFTGSGGPGFTPSGVNRSGSKWFVLPSAAWSHRIDRDSAIAVAVYGNGGMNTDYKSVANPACVSPPLPDSYGPFCGGRTGVNLMQVFVSAGYARKLGDAVSIGVAPVFGFQIFKARGLDSFAFDPVGNPLTVDPTKLTDNGNSTSTGVGIRGGILVKLAPQVRIGASYQSEMNMSKFDKYAGLFENGGDFDIPSSFTLGASIDVTPGVTVNADFRHINYEDVDAVANSSTIPQQFGSKGGPGFGWTNVDVYKLGVDAQVDDAVAVRAGVSFNNNPVPATDATINILAPGVIKRHYTAGASFALGQRSALDLSLLYAPNATTTGIEITPAGPNPGHLIELKMHQFEVGLAWSRKL